MDTPTTYAQDLPSSTHFVDSLISEIADIKVSPTSQVNAEDRNPRLSTTPQEKQAQNVLTRLSTAEAAKIKPIILTLHCLFPNDLLPALDILDRQLVHRLHVINAEPNTAAAEQSKASNTTQVIPDPQLLAQTDTYLVTSAAASSAHGPGTGTGTSTSASTQSPTPPEKGYQVRLHAWNCSCPTFAFSAFRDHDARLALSAAQPAHRDERHEAETVYPFGGTLACATDRDSPPVCKHILACVLFARCPALFGGDGDGSRRVSVEELAGWCAGWGG